MTSSFTPDVIYDFMWRNFYEEKPFMRRLIMLTIIYTIINRQIYKMRNVQIGAGQRRKFFVSSACDERRQ